MYAHYIHPTKKSINLDMHLMGLKVILLHFALQDISSVGSFLDFWIRIHSAVFQEHLSL